MLDVFVEGEDEPIGTTANHPFWSEDRHEFVRADALRPGEHLLANNMPVAVSSIVSRAGPDPVFNLEVFGDHTYHVGSSPVLVHNGGLKLPGLFGACSQPKTAAPTKVIPNPGGRLGNAATRAKASEVVADLQSRGFTQIRTEVQFRTGSLGSGKERFADIVGRNPVTGQTEIIQIGRTIKSDPRVPVIRERNALDDIIFSPAIREFPNSTIRFVDVNRPGVIQP